MANEFQLPDIDLDGIFAEINEAYMDRMIANVRDRTYKVAKDLAKHYGKPFHELPRKLQKSLYCEAALIVEDMIVEDSHGRIF